VRRHGHGVRYRVVATVGTADLDSGNGTDVDVVRQEPTGADVVLAKVEHPCRHDAP